MSIEPAHISEAKEFLEKNRTAVIATCVLGESTPHASTIYYIYNNSQSIFFATTRGGKKADSIILGSRVALVVTHEEEKQTMQIEGRGQIVSDPIGRIEILEDIYKKVKENSDKPLIWPLLKLEPEDVEIIEIKIDWFKYSHFSDEANIVEGSGIDLQIVDTNG